MSKYAHQYNLAFLPAMLFYGIRGTTRKFLASVNRNTVATILTLFGIPLQMACLYIFLKVLELDHVGIGLACVVTNGILMISLEIYACCCVKELCEAFSEATEDNDNYMDETVLLLAEEKTEPTLAPTPDEKYTILSSEGLYEYLTLGWPNVLAICSEVWAY